MPSPRAAALAVVVGLGVGLYFALWFRWPTFLAVAIGATMAIVLLLFASSLADDPAAADAEWRNVAPDLATRERGATDERNLDRVLSGAAADDLDHADATAPAPDAADAPTREPTA